MSLSEELVAAERRGWEALVAGQGGVYYREHLTANALMAFSFGVLAREAAIEAIKAAPPWEWFEITEPRVVELTDDSAVLVYNAVARRPGQQPYSAVISSTFLRAADGWKLAFHQQSPRPD